MAIETVEDLRGMLDTEILSEIGRLAEAEAKLTAIRALVQDWREAVNGPNQTLIGIDIILEDA